MQYMAMKSVTAECLKQYSRLITCTKVGWEECGQSHNLELCPPNIGCDLSKVILLKSQNKEKRMDFSKLF